MLEQIALFTLGWLGGVLSPALIEAIKSRRETVAVLDAVKTELNEISYRLVLASYSIEQHLGSADRKFLKWVQKSMAFYYGQEPTETIATYIRTQLSWTDEQLALHVASEASQGVKALTDQNSSFRSLMQECPVGTHCPLRFGWHYWRYRQTSVW